jgi:hypothetical protein
MEGGGDQKPQLLGAVHKVMEGKWAEWIVITTTTHAKTTVSKH